MSTAPIKTPERVVPTFTRRGFVTGNPVEKLDYILSYFFETLPSQSWMNYTGGVSIQELIANNTDNLENLMNDIQRSLEDKLRLYFEDASVVAEYRNPEEVRRSGRADISIRVIVTDKGQQYTTGREFSKIKSVFRMVAQEVNYGR